MIFFCFFTCFNFCIKKSIPLILGVTFGYTILITLAAGGLNVIFNAYPKLKIIIKIEDFMCENPSSKSLW